MGTADSREFDRLKGRKFKPYSLGHQRMYTKAIDGIKADKLNGSPADIFEAGFGIGWGLEQMLAAGVVNSYVGCEPQVDSFNYVEKTVMAQRWPRAEGVWLRHEPFGSALVESMLSDGVAPFEHAFCIEVIEHVPLDDHLAFLQNLHNVAPVLWFSTPDIRTSPKEGVRTTLEWKGLLHLAGFDTVDVDSSEWTTLYHCK